MDASGRSTHTHEPRDHRDHCKPRADREPPATAVNLTENAALKVKALLDQEGRDDLALRIAVQPGGCSGLRYQLFFDERQLDGDERTDWGGFDLVVDRMSLPYLGGATHRLRRHDREAGLHDRQPERDGFLRLRRLVQLESAALGPRRNTHAKAPDAASIGGFSVRCRRVRARRPQSGRPSRGASARQRPCVIEPDQRVTDQIGRLLADRDAPLRRAAASTTGTGAAGIRHVRRRAGAGSRGPRAVRRRGASCASR